MNLVDHLITLPESAKVEEALAHWRLTGSPFRPLCTGQRLLAKNTHDDAAFPYLAPSEDTEAGEREYWERELGAYLNCRCEECQLEINWIQESLAEPIGHLID